MVSFFVTSLSNPLNTTDHCLRCAIAGEVASTLPNQTTLAALERELQLIEYEKQANSEALRIALQRKAEAKRTGTTASSLRSSSRLKGADKLAWEHAIMADELS